ncbi:MAG: DUF2721 domain-containing protein [Pseudohongiellaceae bacterium]
MDSQAAIETIAGVIQLAVAPVFLLAGIAGMLNVLSVRLGRVVDRFRAIEARIIYEDRKTHLANFQQEASGLWKRIRLVNWSIRMFVVGALLISIVIVALFCGELVEIDFSLYISILFVTAMYMLIMGLILFLFEVSISTTQINAGIKRFLASGEENNTPS